MNVQHSVGHDLMVVTGRFLAHAVALVVGMILMVAGIAMGVTIAMLPIGIPVGFVGLACFMWGLFGGGEVQYPHAQPPRQVSSPK